MTRDDEIINQYFDWLYSIVCKDEPYRRDTSYTRLLARLHNITFQYTLPKDQDRAIDGEELRWYFVCDHNYTREQDYVLSCLAGPCSVLEMMVALAMKMEGIMDDASVGNRTSQWFWGMITSLGLGSMYDVRFDRMYVEDRIERFHNKEYLPNGRGGLFTIKNCDEDLRDCTIWHQLCRYLGNFT